MGHRKNRYAAFRRGTGGTLVDFHGASGRDLFVVIRKHGQVGKVYVRAFAEGRREIEGAVRDREGRVREAESEGRDVTAFGLIGRAYVVQNELEIVASISSISSVQSKQQQHTCV